MTVSNLDSKVSYDCDGSCTEFPFSFKIFDAGDLRVVLTDPDGNQSDLSISSDYSVAAAGGDFALGGEVTTATAYATNNTITLIREIEASQNTQYADTVSFPARMHEDSLDRLTILAQQLQEQLSRALKFNLLDSGTEQTLPTSAERALKWFGFDAEGGPIAAAGSTGTPVSTFMADFLAAANAAAARNYIDVEPLTVATILAALTGSDPQMGLYVQEVSGELELFFDSNDPDTAPDPVQLTSGGLLNINAVTLTGDQTIAGEKTFSTIPKIPTTTPDDDAQVVCVKSVDDKIAAIDSIKATVNGTPTSLKCVVFSGNLTGYADKSIAHGIDATKIASATSAIYHSSGACWYTSELYMNSATTTGWKAKYDSTYFTLFSIGEIHSNQNYKVTIWYYE